MVCTDEMTITLVVTISVCSAVFADKIQHLFILKREESGQF